MKYANPQNFTVVGLKTWNTDDGGGYQGKLAIGGKSVITFHNDGNGGEMQIDGIVRFMAMGISPPLRRFSEFPCRVWR